MHRLSLVPVVLAAALVPAHATDDPFFGDLSPNNIIERNRSNHVTGPSGVRHQINEITAWIDGSNVYGSDAVRAGWLRTFSGGKLRTSNGGALGDLLPKWEAGAPPMDASGMPSMGTNAYVAGDSRANENVALLSLHTLFVGILAEDDLPGAIMGDLGMTLLDSRGRWPRHSHRFHGR